jgi:hypothetical protein
MECHKHLNAAPTVLDLGTQRDLTHFCTHRSQFLISAMQLFPLALRGAVHNIGKGRLHKNAWWWRWNLFCVGFPIVSVCMYTLVSGTSTQTLTSHALRVPIFLIMFETVCMWLVCYVDISGVGTPLALSRWLSLSAEWRSGRESLFARPLGMSGGNVVNWICLPVWKVEVGAGMFCPKCKQLASECPVFSRLVLSVCLSLSRRTSLADENGPMKCVSQKVKMMVVVYLTADGQ